MTAVAEIPAPLPVRLPTDEDLPYSDGIPLESNRQVLQIELLRQALTLHWRGRRKFFCGGNMFLYFNAERMLKEDFRGPDFFVALDVKKRPSRKSWVVWDEGKAPDVVIELLSRSTRQVDKTVKKQVYQDQVRVPEYFWYDPDKREFAGFALCDGVYRPIEPDYDGKLQSGRLGLSLVRWRGVFAEEKAEWLRWATRDGVLLPTPYELAEEQRLRAEEQQRRADRMAEQLRALGVEPGD